MAPTLECITFDCANAAALADFYAELLDMPVDEGANEFYASIGRSNGHGPGLMFLQVPERTPGKNAVHLDLAAADLPAEVERAVALGAKHIGDFHEFGIRWSTLADPEGNLFDIAASED
ncbi:VOC family protein [Nocardia paucivorans]|uniref:VOC family protein n=1 Tax=Nocardia paucivorans TaxID=114259 RepID=UPI00030FC37E|nr:VOC family protein [Nocardia paucivorans]